MAHWEAGLPEGATCCSGERDVHNQPASWQAQDLSRKIIIQTNTTECFAGTALSYVRANRLGIECGGGHRASTGESDVREQPECTGAYWYAPWFYARIT